MKKAIFISAVVIMITGTVFVVHAQRFNDPEAMAKKHTEFMKEHLDLTDDQAKKVEAIGLDFAKKMQALRKSSNNDKEKMHAEFEKLRDEKHEEIKSILDQDQIKKFDEFKSLHTGMRGPHGGKKGMHGPGNMGICDPVLLEKRQAFDRELNKEEKAVISDFRSKLPEIMEEIHERWIDQKDECDGKPKGLMRAEMVKEFAPILDIAEKHKGELESIGKDHFQKKKQTMKDGECRGSHGQNGFGKGHGHKEKGKGHGRGHGMMNKEDIGKMFSIHFLLMDTDEAASVGQSHDRILEVMPNPSNSSNTLNYEVLSSGKVKIDVLNKDGFIVKTILDATKEAGEYSLNVNVSDLEQNLYFYRITDRAGTQSVKFIVAR